jgi:ketosteroid isomerase-like protein
VISLINLMETWEWAVSQSDIDKLTALNRSYVASVQNSDVDCFREILAEDFLCTNPDGSLLSKAEFLELIERPAKISGLIEDQVKVRLFGDFAIIHARITYRSSAGKERVGRYTDDWARRGGTWVCVSAQTAGEEF